MSKLASLRSRLAVLRRRRFSLRIAVAGSMFALALVAILAGLFVLDWSLEPGRGWRLLL